MVRKLKIAACDCAICNKWNATLNDVSMPWSKSFTPDLMQTRGCDLCGNKEATGLLWVPDPIQSFFNLNRLCVHCRARIEWVQQQYQWRICWGSSPDSEIKWFLATLVYEDFRNHFDGERGAFGMWHECCVEGAHAHRAPVKPQPWRWPGQDEWEQQNKEDTLKIEIQLDRMIRPRVKLRTEDQGA